MTEHELHIKADAVVSQQMVYRLGTFEITNETVLRRRGAKSVKCSCGFEFDVRGRRLKVIEAAKNHLKNVDWEEDHLADDEDPLRRGDTIQVSTLDDQPDWDVVEVSGSEIEVHMDGGVLPIETREQVRSAIDQTRENGEAVRVIGADGETKAI